MARKKDPEVPPESQKSAPGAKSGPTRSRRAAEAANRRPLVPKDRKLAKQRDREKQNEAYAKEREALITGDERYLPARDRGPIRRYIRDWVDARWSISEWLLPVMLLFLVGTTAVTFLKPSASVANIVMVGVMGLFYGLLIVSIIESVIVWFRMKKRLAVEYPGVPIPRGSWFYLYTRMLMARRWRSPKTQVARGAFPGKTARKGKAEPGAAT